MNNPVDGDHLARLIEVFREKTTTRPHIHAPIRQDVVSMLQKFQVIYHTQANSIRHLEERIAAHDAEVDVLARLIQSRTATNNQLQEVVERLQKDKTADVTERERLKNHIAALEMELNATLLSIMTKVLDDEKSAASTPEVSSTQ
jgi:hypothetical protein